MSEPQITVVVPTFDRPEQLQECLEALGRCSQQVALEVIVADDGGRVEVDQAASAFGGDRLNVVLTGGRGPAAARNGGAATSRTALLAFTDDDCRPEPGWAAALVARSLQDPGALIGGKTINALPGNSYSRAAQGIADAAIAHHNSGPDGPRFFPSNNVALSADRFAELGGFDETLPLPGGEDRDLCERWAERGWPLVAEPDAIVEHAHDLGIGSFWRQQRDYGAGAYRHRRARAERGGGFKLEPSLTSGVLTGAARGAIGDRDPARLALLGVWQLATLRGFVGAAIGRGEKAAG
jgi:GT2 family glycosyltransferase